MDYVIIGGDARLGHLEKLLRARGLHARRVYAGGEDARAVLDVPELIGSAKNIVTNCPPKAKGVELDLTGLLAMAAPDTNVLLCGPDAPDVEDARIVDLWRDEALLRENARLTAEGAVSAAMQASRRSLRGQRCVVIGWGRIGSALAELLVALGVRVTVASRTAAHRHRAIERGAEALPMERLGEVLPGADIVFSTPPVPVLGRDLLARVRPGALVIDLASPPYGVDLHAAWALGLRAWREPGLPGRYCPESAAGALLDALLRHRREAD